MAEEGNGTFSVRSGDKSIGIGGKDAIYLLFVLMIGALGYFVGMQVTTNQQHGLQALAAVVETLGSNQATLVELVHTNRQQLEEGSRAQTVLLHQQTTLITSKVDEQSGQLNARFEKVDAQFQRVDMELSILNHNIHKDINEQLPLMVPLAPAR